VNIQTIHEAFPFPGSRHYRHTLKLLASSYGLDVCSFGHGRTNINRYSLRLPPTLRPCVARRSAALASSALAAGLPDPLERLKEMEEAGPLDSAPQQAKALVLLDGSSSPQQQGGGGGGGGFTARGIWRREAAMRIVNQRLAISQIEMYVVAAPPSGLPPVYVRVSHFRLN
jgi:hypothetical protein